MEFKYLKLEQYLTDGKVDVFQLKNLLKQTSARKSNLAAIYYREGRNIHAALPPKGSQEDAVRIGINQITALENEIGKAMKEARQTGKIKGYSVIQESPLSFEERKEQALASMEEDLEGWYDVYMNYYGRHFNKDGSPKADVFKMMVKASSPADAYRKSVDQIISLDSTVYHIDDMLTALIEFSPLHQ